MEIKRTIAWHIYTEVKNVFRVVNDIKTRTGVYIRRLFIILYNNILYRQHSRRCERQTYNKIDT